MRSKQLCLCLFVLLSVCVVGMAEDISYLPADALSVQTVAAPANEMMVMIEQSGLIPYKGHSSSDASMAFETGEDGTEYGDNEYTRVSLSLMHYKAAFKDSFDQRLQLAHPSLALQQAETDAKSGGSSIGGMTLLARSINRIAADDGEMLLITNSIQCVESQYPTFAQTSYQSYAVVGSSIIMISGTYNSSDAKLARRIHNETVARIKKSDLLAE